MLKRMMILLCVLVLMGGAACAQGLPDDAQMLSLFFPGDPFEPVEDFKYTNEPLLEGKEQFLYGARASYKVKEVQPFGGLYLVVVEWTGATHMDGYGNHSFAMYDPAAGALVGEPLHCVADGGEYSLFLRDGVASVLYVGRTVYTGLESFSGGRWAWQDGQWQMAWPVDELWSDAYYAFWDRRKVEIVRDDPGSVKTYLREPNPDGQDLGDYHWEEETYMYTLDADW